MIALKRRGRGASNYYLFGFFGVLPSKGFSYFAWTTVISPVFETFSKEVAVMGKGTFSRPTVFPGARRK